MSKLCFHCHSEVKDASVPKLSVLGEEREFCCNGCEAVCKAIVDSGNEDYYKYRTAPSGNASRSEELDAMLERLRLYDHPDIQKDFVRSFEGAREASLLLEEIHCAACLWLNEQHLRKLPGVLDVEMDYAAQQARVRWDPEQIKLSDILRAITDIGYVAHPYDPAQREALLAEQKHRDIKRIVIAVVFGMMVMQFSFSTYFFGGADAAGKHPLWIEIGRWTSLAVTALLMAYPGQVFFRDAWRDLKHRRLGMDVPVVLGLSIAWLGSLRTVLTGQGEVYFESIAMFVLFLLLARYAEFRARVVATGLLDRLNKIVPRMATRLTEGGIEERSAVVDIKPGERLRLSPGETVPVDGILEEGVCQVDESLLTGEARPVLKHRGDLLVSGSIVVDQNVVITAARDSHDSTLSDMSRLVSRGAQSKPGYVQIADRVSVYFVGVILLIAVATFVYWSVWGEGDAIANVVAVLIVTCPCALALAAPVALSLSAAGLSQYGVLPLRMDAIERLKKINHAAFDKTGTLTEGRPKVERTECRGSRDVSWYLGVAAALESGSEHPYAKAITEAVGEQVGDRAEFTVLRRRNEPGKGIAGEIEGEEWRIGNATFVTNAEVQDEAEDLREYRKGGGTVLFLGRRGAVEAVFFLVDPLRQGVESFLATLHQRGIKHLAVLSGDHPESVDAVAKRLGIDVSFGGVSPREKMDWVASQQRAGHKVAMFGDGVNDAPTLAQADVSFSFSGATDLAQASSDFIILRHGYEALGDVWALLYKTDRIIRQNLLWALLYNLTAIPFASMGMVPPWAAALGMSLSSTLVVANALRLRRAV
ncbi:MAG: heavy metal translocating P-type ATPase [bacterium]